MAGGEEGLAAFGEVLCATDCRDAESKCGDYEAPKRLTDQQRERGDDQSYRGYCESHGDDR